MHMVKETTSSLNLSLEGRESFPEISCLSFKMKEVIPHPTHLTGGV